MKRTYRLRKKLFKKRFPFSERKLVGISYGGDKTYWCRNCGQVYELKGLRPIRLAPTPAVAQKLRSAEKHQARFTRKIGRTTNESV